MARHIKFSGDFKDEIWKDIVGYEDIYEVSSLGRVKSLPKQRGTAFVGSFLLSPKNNRDGYLCVSLNKNKNKKHVMVHRLVAQAFHINPENKKTVNHIDCNKKNNNASNLEWNTHKENVNHAWGNGLCTPHVSHNKILSDADCKAIRELRANTDKTYFELSDMFGVSFGHIGVIARGEKRA